MDPLTVSAALKVAQVLGVDKMFGRLFGGKKGEEVAGKVMDITQQVTGARDVASIEAAVQQDPALALQLVLQLNQLAAEADARSLADVADARDMQESAIKQEDPFVRRFLYVFAAVLVILGMSYIFSVTFYTVPPDNQRMADATLGWVTGSLMTTIIVFFFGASHRSPISHQSR